MEPNKHHGEKAFLIFISIVVGVVVFLFLALERIPAAEIVNIGSVPSPVYESHPATELSLKNQSTKSLIIFSLIGLGVAFFYAISAAVFIGALQDIRTWAYLNNVESLPDDTILVWAAFWPLAFLAGGIIYVFVGIINRIF